MIDEWKSVKGEFRLAGGKCRNGKWLCFTLYFFRVSIFSLSGHCVHHYWSITAMYNTETNFYTRVKLNLVLFFSIILLLVTLHLKLWKNIVEYSHFREDVKAKTFFSSIRENGSNIRTETWYLSFFFCCQ